MRAILERKIEAHLVCQVRKRGGEVRKVKWIGRRGAPDRYVMLPGSSAWVELKRTGVKAEDHQLREHNRMIASGAVVVVLDSKSAVDDWLGSLDHSFDLTGDAILP